jgi:hypothetical protein
LDLSNLGGRNVSSGPHSREDCVYLSRQADRIDPKLTGRLVCGCDYQVDRSDEF